MLRYNCMLEVQPKNALQVQPEIDSTDNQKLCCMAMGQPETLLEVQPDKVTAWILQGAGGPGSLRFYQHSQGS